MFVTRLLTLLVLLIFIVTDIGPIPITSLIGLYAVIFRPAWFKRLVGSIYS